MAKFRFQKNSLLGGEISPTAFGRTDLQFYNHSCEKMQNVLPILSGGAYRRPGTRFYRKFTDTLAPALYPFPRTTGGFIIVIGRNEDNSQYVMSIETSPSTTNVAYTDISTSHPWKTVTVINKESNVDEWHQLRHVQSGDTMWFCHPNRVPYKLIYNQLLESFTFQPYYKTSAGADITGNDLMNMVAWDAQNINASCTLAYSGTLTVGSTGTLTMSGGNLSYTGQTTVGQYYKMNVGGTIGVVRVDLHTSQTTANVTVMTAMGGTSAVNTWWKSAWSEEDGYPREVCFYQDRLCFLGNQSKPDSMWFSQESNYSVMSVAAHVDPNQSGDGVSYPKGTQPFTATLASTQLNKIQWAAPDKTLLIGTEAEEWIISPVTTGVFGADNSQGYVVSKYGSSYNKAVKAGNEIIFSHTSSEAMAFTYLNDEQSFNAERLQLMFDEYPKLPITSALDPRSIKKMEWDNARRTVWFIDTIGNLWALTRDRKTSVSCFTTHKLGGYEETIFGHSVSPGGTAARDPGYTSSNTYRGSVASIAVMYSGLTGTNDVWFVVRRYINGEHSYTIERMIGDNIHHSSAYNAFVGSPANLYLDCATVTTNDYPDPENFTYGSTYFKNETLDFIANSANNGLFELPSYTLNNSGIATITSPPSDFETTSYIVVYGYGFESIIKTVRIEAGSQIGSAQSAIKRIHEANIRFYKTMSAKVGSDENNLEEIIFRSPSVPNNKSHDIFTGDKLVKLDSDYDRDGYVYILQDSPLPFSVISIQAEGQTYD